MVLVPLYLQLHSSTIEPSSLGHDKYIFLRLDTIAQLIADALDYLLSPVHHSCFLQFPGTSHPDEQTDLPSHWPILLAHQVLGQVGRYIGNGCHKRLAYPRIQVSPP